MREPNMWSWCAGEGASVDKKGRARRLYWVTSKGESHRFTIYRRKRGVYWIIDDPDGSTRFSKKVIISGPHRALREAKVYYLTQLHVRGEL